MPHNRMRRRLRWFAAWAARLDGRDWWREAMHLARRGASDARSWMPLFRAGEDGAGPRMAGAVSGAGEASSAAPAGMAGTAVGVEQPGPGRAAEFVINVLAPALHVLAVQRGDAMLARLAARLFFSVTPAPGNRLTRLVEHGFGLGRVDAGAQQGMIELASAFCSPRQCTACLRGATRARFRSTTDGADIEGRFRPESLPV